MQLRIENTNQLDLSNFSKYSERFSFVPLLLVVSSVQCIRLGQLGQYI